MEYISVRQLASELGVSKQAINYRLARLTDKEKSQYMMIEARKGQQTKRLLTPEGAEYLRTNIKNNEPNEDKQTNIKDSKEPTNKTDEQTSVTVYQSLLKEKDNHIQDLKDTITQLLNTISQRDTQYNDLQLKCSDYEKKLSKTPIKKYALVSGFSILVTLLFAFGVATLLYINFFN